MEISERHQVITAIIQARVTSSRLPNKIFAEIVGKPLLWHVVNRLTFCKYVQQIVVATSTNPLDDSVELWAVQNHLDCFRGDEHDVLARYYGAAERFKADIIARITADDPLKDPIALDYLALKLLNEKLDFVYNNNPPSYPEGMDIEVFTFEALKTAYENAKTQFDREHVTQYFYRNPILFRQQNTPYIQNLSSLRWTIDTAEDLAMVRQIYDALWAQNSYISFQAALEYVLARPEVWQINSKVKRSFMYTT